MFPGRTHLQSWRASERQETIGAPLPRDLDTDVGHLGSTLFYEDTGADKCRFGALPLAY